MHGQEVVPLHNIQLYDINDDLERDNDQLEKDVVNEVVNLDAELTCYLCLVVKQPK